MQQLILPSVHIYIAILDISSQLLHLRYLTVCEKLKYDNTTAKHSTQYITSQWPFTSAAQPSTQQDIQLSPSTIVPMRIQFYKT
jgi:hypothetical protein